MVALFVKQSGIFQTFKPAGPQRSCNPDSSLNRWPPYWSQPRGMSLVQVSLSQVVTEYPKINIVEERHVGQKVRCTYRCCIPHSSEHRAGYTLFPKVIPSSSCLGINWGFGKLRVYHCTYLNTNRWKKVKDEKIQLDYVLSYIYRYVVSNKKVRSLGVTVNGMFQWTDFSSL